ncbi:MAG: argininosuccinate synthase [Planctomycetes bacterium]|nr:argininosuccinate synthase [Planctomycetota bacterium]
MSKDIRKIVLSYSGGLDTSVIMRWLIERYQAEVIAFTADLGQGEDLRGVRKKALRTGAVKAYVEDVREEFASDFIFPMMRANAIYEGGYLMGTSIARPLIAKKQVEIAIREKADAIAHGATGKGNDQVRFELTAYSLKPDIRVVAPWREWEFKSRSDLVRYASEHGIPVPVTVKKPYSMDRNMLHLSFEGGILEDPWREPPEDMFVLTVSPERAPNRPTTVEIEFHEGNPVSVDGRKLSPARTMAALNELGGKNGIGRVDMVENRFVGMKSRGVYETPGGTILHVAHRAMESITMDREVMHLRDTLIPRYAEMIYYGFWFSPERQMLQGLIDHSQRTVSGTVRLKLYKGNCSVVGRKSPRSLYNPELATFEADQVYNQKDAEGFIKLNALRLRMGTMVERSQLIFTTKNKRHERLRQGRQQR